ncbi:MAG: efflux RND transporter periplasmic adaptor subunit [Bacteroidales bacterium]|nr:efflux RND transporter periplasmic adaptor subunit [Bacteroidales bacterium]
MKFLSRLTALTLILLSLMNCNRPEENVDTELAVPVSIMEIKLQSIEKYINTTGTVFATQETELKSEIAGNYLLSKNPSTGRSFKLGDRVKEGQVIVQLKDKEYENNIAIESKRLNQEISEQEFSKQESLHKKGGVTLRELRNSEVSYINAKYEYENALLRLEKLQIKAPFSGVIVDLPYNTPGTRITAGQSMVKLMDYKKLYMEINLPEKNIQEAQLNQEVMITNYSLPDDTLSGRISELSPVISTETRTFKGKLLIDNPELKLRPGMFVKADIIVDHKDSTVVIPKNLILSSSSGNRVFIVDQGTAYEKKIDIGLDNLEEAEIIKGLEVNEKLVIKGYETLRDRSKVKVIK